MNPLNPHPDLSILVVSFNTRELTLACLESIEAQTRDITWELLVVDNDSTDGSADAIAERFPRARVIRPGRNLGFAAANNLAAGHARGERLLLLNPDTVVLDGAIQKLHAFAVSQPAADICGGRTRFPDGSLNPASCWRAPTLWSVLCAGTGLTRLFPHSALFAPESYGGWQRNSVREVEIVSGCFLMIHRFLWDRLGGFDPAFFMYGEEADLCLRAQHLGARCLICPDAEIVHHGGASERVRADKMVRLFEAKAKLFARHWGTLSRPLGVLGIDLWAASRMLGLAAMRRIRPHHASAHEAWRAIWRRRNEWHRAAALGH